MSINLGRLTEIAVLKIFIVILQADWRLIEQWKIIREQEKAAKAAKGESTEAWAEDKGYLPNRIRRNN